MAFRAYRGLASVLEGRASAASKRGRKAGKEPTSARGKKGKPGGQSKPEFLPA